MPTFFVVGDSQGRAVPLIAAVQVKVIGRKAQSVIVNQVINNTFSVPQLALLLAHGIVPTPPIGRLFNALDFLFDPLPIRFHQPRPFPVGRFHHFS